MKVIEIIEKKLSEGLSSASIKVEDESYKHAGHAGARPEGETHFSVEIESEKFEGLTRVERHRVIHEILSEEMGNPIHALSIKAKAPSETEF